jgi:hypothetical protein
MTEGQKPTVDAPATNITPVEIPPAISNTNTPKPAFGKPWRPGQSGNPAGRPKIEPRVRKLARKYDRRMVKVLASIAEDPKVSATERRRAAMDLIAIGSGRPATTQELLGRPDAPLGPLVSINMSNPGTSSLSPAQARAVLRRPRDATPAQVEAAERVLFEAAAAAALPSPAPVSAIETTAQDQDERPNNVVQLGTRIDQEAQ